MTVVIGNGVYFFPNGVFFFPLCLAVFFFSPMVSIFPHRPGGNSPPPSWLCFCFPPMVHLTISGHPASNPPGHPLAARPPSHLNNTVGEKINTLGEKINTMGEKITPLGGEINAKREKITPSWGKEKTPLGKEKTPWGKKLTPLGKKLTPWGKK